MMASGTPTFHGADNKQTLPWQGTARTMSSVNEKRNVFCDVTLIFSKCHRGLDDTITKSAYRTLAENDLEPSL